MGLKYLALDTETGGIGPEADLLTAYFGVYDENFNLLHELDLKIRPESEDDFFHVSAKALEINKIHLPTHFREAETKTTAGRKLIMMLKFASDNGANKLLPIGHNVQFDIRKVQEKLLNKGAWDHFVSYRVLDTGSIGQFLKIQGKIPAEVSGSLTSFVDHFKIGFNAGDAHTAKGDAVATAMVMKEMLKL